MNNFSDLSLSTPLARNLAAGGFTQPTPVQAQSIPPALEGRDIVATAQTGTGKTLAFLLPVLERLSQQPATKGVQAVILSPTRELALQIQEEFRKLAPGTGIRAAVAVGGLNENPQLAAIRQGAQVLIATPGRLCDFLQRRLVKLGTVRNFVLDEADRMLDMGFLPAIEQILSHVPAERQTLLFSATIEQAVAHLIEKNVTNPVRISIGSTRAPAEGINLRAYEVDHASKVDLLHSLLSAEAGSFLVFSRTKHGADRLARRLSTAGVKTAAIHGDRSQNQRNQALRGFQDGYYRVLVATDVAARGIHVDDVAHVVNFDLPQVPEDFIHRVGRTGRAGRRGVASSFHTPAERGEIRRIERALSLKLERLPLPERVEMPEVAAPFAKAPAAKAPEVKTPEHKPLLHHDKAPSSWQKPRQGEKRRTDGPVKQDAKQGGKPWSKAPEKSFAKPFARKFPTPEAEFEGNNGGRFSTKPESKFGPKAGAKSGFKPASKFGEKNGSGFGKKFAPKPGGDFDSRRDARFGEKNGSGFGKKFGPKPGGDFDPRRDTRFGPKNGSSSGPRQGFAPGPKNGRATGEGGFRTSFGFTNPSEFAPSRKPRAGGHKSNRPQSKPQQSGGWRKFGSRP